MKIYIIIVDDSGDSGFFILGATTDKVEAEKFVHAFNLAREVSGEKARIEEFLDLKLPEAWS